MTQTHQLNAEQTLLVFGRSGQVATELQARGTVIALGRETADLCKPGECAELILQSGASAVINAAAYTAVDHAEEDEAVASVVNGAAPAAMARACAALEIPFVHISTDYVFDGSGTQPWAPTDKPNPLGAYGRSKLLGEDGIRASGARYAILRTSWVFSAHGSNFVKTMLRLAETREHLTVVHDQIGGPTSAGDIAEACLSIANQMRAGQSGGTYHFSGAPDVSWADFAREIFDQSGYRVSVEDIPSSQFKTKAVRPSNSRMACETLEADFGISRPDWKRSLADVLQHLKVD